MTSTASQPAAPPSLRGGLICLFSGLLLGLAGELFFLLPPLLSRHGLSFRGAYAASMIVALGATSLLLVGLLRCRELPVESETRLFLWMTLVGWLLMLPLQLISLVQTVGGGPYSAELSRAMGWAWRSAGPLAGFGLNLFLRQLASWRGRRVQTTLCTANLTLVLGAQVLAAFAFVSRAPGQGPTSIDQLRWGLFLATSALEVVLAGLALWGGGPAVTAAARTGAAPALDDLRWAAAARGLLLHRKGVLTKLVAVLVAGMLVPVSAGQLQLAKAMMLLMPAASLAITGMLAAGIIGFLRAPAEAGGRGLGIAALLVILLGALLDLYTLAMVWSFLERPSFSTLEIARQLEPVTLGAGLLGLLLLLGSIRRVARHLELQSVVRRTLVVSWLAGVMLIPAGAMKAESVVRQLGPGILALGLPVLGLAIWVLVSYLRLLRELAGAIQERSPGL